ncbi:MAG: replication factor C small subunit [Candidatus Aenigmarchaeota archaeon]|nr:replication factor C small subunit [Candidatus Aenigmarchaeota archaeon]
MDFSIWTEKYRPRKLKEVINQKHVVERLKFFVKEYKIPHMIFAGPPGTGKTCCAVAIAREIFGKNWKQNFQETNASDMRGIDVIRTRIKNFSRIKPIGESFKIIFLDEADSLTSDAQNALRRLMEMYSGVTRFILSCNYSSRIISPIQSRAAVFRFKSLSRENVFEYMKRIVNREKLKIDKKALEAIYLISGGDLRKAVNILQASAVLGKKITKNTIYEVAAQAEPKEVIDMIDYALNGKFLDSREILKDLLLKRGISGQDIIKEISKQLYKLDISDKVKIGLVEKVGEFEFRLNQGGNEQLQLEALLSQFALYKK